MEQSNYQYTIEDISNICQKTKQSIYNLIKQNQGFIKNNSKRYGKRIRYNQEALNFFLDHYGMQTPGITQDTLLDPLNDHNNGTTSTTSGEGKGNPLPAEQAKIEALQAEIDRLNQLLEDKEAERKELLNQNGALILTLQQEKQEKMLLLPAPRKGIGETIKGWFKKTE